MKKYLITALALFICYLVISMLTPISKRGHVPGLDTGWGWHGTTFTVERENNQAEPDGEHLDSNLVYSGPCLAGDTFSNNPRITAYGWPFAWRQAYSFGSCSFTAGYNYMAAALDAGIGLFGSALLAIPVVAVKRKARA